MRNGGRSGRGLCAPGEGNKSEDAIEMKRCLLASAKKFFTLKCVGQNGIRTRGDSAGEFQFGFQLAMKLIFIEIYHRAQGFDFDDGEFELLGDAIEIEVGRLGEHLMGNGEGVIGFHAEGTRYVG